MKKRIATSLLMLFYAMFTLSFSWVVAHTVIGGYYKYDEVGILFCIVCATALLLGCWKLVKRLEAPLGKYEKAITAVFLTMMFVLQMVVGGMLRFQPKYDLGYVYNGAIQWAETGTFVSQFDYFYRYFNNWGILTLFAGIFRLAHLLGITDYFMTATAVNALLSVTTMLVTGMICKRLLGIRGQIMAYVLFAVSPPFYFIAPAFYTDAVCMLFPVLTYWLYLLAKDQPKLRIRVLLYALMGVSLSVGVMIKATAAIVFVAIVIDALFSRRLNWESLISMVAVAAAMVVIGQAGLRAVIFTQLDPNEAERRNTPVYHWIMMGLSGSGGYTSSDESFTQSFDNPAERNAAIKEEIKTRIVNWGPDGMVKLLTKKSVMCFGDGTYGLSDFLALPSENETPLRTLVTKGDDPAPYWLYQHITSGLLLALYLLMIASGLQELLVASSRSFRMLVPRVAVFGLLLFLIWWEARWRYFSSYIPLIFISALLGMESASQAVSCAGKSLRNAWRRPD